MKQIKFFPKSLESEILVDKPQPSKNYIPQWYKDMPSFYNKKITFNNGIPDMTAKMCVPFSDAFKMGYIQETWCDIYIESDSNDRIRYYFSSGPQIMDHRTHSSMPKNNFYYDIEFSWKLQWIPQLPKGYSVIYTHPFNFNDLPFQSATGIVDSDKLLYENDANHPFYLKKGFTGLIPKGTPMYQVIPFKRDSWKSDFLQYDFKKQMLANNTRKYFWGAYKKMFHSKKVFE